MQPFGVGYTTARRFAVAPMLACTNRHARYFYRLLSSHALLYTEMIHANAALGKQAHRELQFDPREKPLVAQLAGNDPARLAEAARRCQEYGYDAVNLNIGCPSNKVRMGEFGACLMRQPELVAEQVARLCARVSIPISVKCRLGVDDQEYHQSLPVFLQLLARAGCCEVVIHARKALLDGLNPKQNRQAPPLDYPFVYLCREYCGDMFLGINGGIHSLEQAMAHLAQVDGVMLGRAVLGWPTLLTRVDELVFGQPARQFDLTRLLWQDYAPYLSRERAAGSAAPPLLKPIINLFKGQPGGARFRRVLSQAQPGVALGDLLCKALDCLGQNAPTDEPIAEMLD